MRPMHRTLILLLLSIAAAAASAQPLAPQQIVLSQEPYERLLVPLVLQEPLPGAYGSLWVSHLVVRNDSSEPIAFAAAPGGPCLDIYLYCPDAVEPKSTTDHGFRFAHNPNAGLFYYVGNPGRTALTVTLRIQDISRQALTWGTSIPVVRERDTYTTPLVLLDVPLDTRFRVAIRTYEFEPTDGEARVRIRVFPLESDVPAVETTLSLLRYGLSVIQNPRFAMIADLRDAFPQLSALDRVRLEIAPASDGLRFWAFASVTNNETQHVTVIAPASPSP
jgi:hypothetical protein